MVFFPVARLVPRSCVREHIGDEIVAFDEELLHFHTMHERVFAMLELSDGSRSSDEIAQLVFDEESVRSRDATGQALLDLMDAGLLKEDADARVQLLTRRTAAKAAVAILLGGVGLPLVKSITAPDAASALSRCGKKGIGESCSTSDSEGCDTCCCCAAASQGTCRTVEFCKGYEELGYSCK